MTYQEIKKESYGSRILQSFQGILFGVILVVGAIVLLFYNEGRTVHRYQTLNKGESLAVSVSAENVDPANEGKLVHLSGLAKTEELLTDVDFGITVNAIQLQRIVEMYQWQEDSSTETREKLGGETENITTYSYQKVWAPNKIDSSVFKESNHQNPEIMAYEGKQLFAKNVFLGDFVIPSSLIKQIGPEEEYLLTQAPSAQPPLESPTPETEEPTVPTSLTSPASGQTEQEEEPVDLEKNETQSLQESSSPIQLVSYQDELSLSLPAATTASNGGTSEISISSDSLSPAVVDESEKNLSVRDTIDRNAFYLGKNPQSPEIGDLRVSFKIVPPNKEISVIAMQQGKSLAPYVVKTGTIELLDHGIHSATDMFRSAHQSNKAMAWILRIIGVIVMCFGFNTLLKPLSTLAGVIPFVGSLVGAGTALFSFFVSIAISFVVIAIAWLFYRPILGGLLLITAGFFFALALRKKNKKTPSTPS